MAKRNAKTPLRGKLSNPTRGFSGKSFKLTIRQYLNLILASSIILPVLWMVYREERSSGWNEGLGTAFKNVFSEVEEELSQEESLLESAAPNFGFSNLGGSSPLGFSGPSNGLRACSFKPVAYREDQQQAGRKSSELIKELEHSTPPINKWFLFHNSMPFTGSQPIAALMHELSKVNNFNFMQIDKPDTAANDKLVADMFDKVGNNGCPDGYSPDAGVDKNPKPLMAMKHHFWMNFTDFSLPQPTYINMIRDPVERFVSEFYHCRHGTEGNPLIKDVNCKYMTRDRLDMTVDECIKGRIEECMEPEFEYFMWLCGSEELCRTKSANYQKKMLTSEFTKHRVLRYYYIVGILEDWEPTLELYEYLLPNFFRGARAVFKSNIDVQKARNASRTNMRNQITESSRRFLKQGPLKYEMDLYKFIERLFYEKLDKLIPEELDILHNVNDGAAAAPVASNPIPPEIPQP